GCDGAARGTQTFALAEGFQKLGGLFSREGFDRHPTNGDPKSINEPTDIRRGHCFGWMSHDWRTIPNTCSGCQRQPSQMGDFLAQRADTSSASLVIHLWSRLWPSD